MVLDGWKYINFPIGFSVGEAAAFTAFLSLVFLEFYGNWPLVPNPVLADVLFARGVPFVRVSPLAGCLGTEPLSLPYKAVR